MDALVPHVGGCEISPLSCFHSLSETVGSPPVTSGPMFPPPPPPSDGMPTSSSTARDFALPCWSSLPILSAALPSLSSVLTHTRTSAPSRWKPVIRTWLSAAYCSAAARTSIGSTAMMSDIPVVATWRSSCCLTLRAAASAAASAPAWAWLEKSAARPTCRNSIPTITTAAMIITSPGMIWPSWRRSSTRAM